MPIETYGKNFAVLVQRLKATGACLIWAEITPVPEGKQNPVSESSDVPRYNAVARRLMESKGIVTDDLYAAALPRLAEIQLPLNVHFNNAGWEALGSEVAAATSGPL